jgi:HSP90 family molecular chaperone
MNMWKEEYKYKDIKITIHVDNNELYIQITDNKGISLSYEDLTEELKEFRYRCLLKYFKMN